jgi:hypothetical protein
MQKRHLLLIVLCTVLLAACNNNTNTSVPPTSAASIQQSGPLSGTVAPPTQIVPTQGPREYAEGTQEVVLPLTGTIVPPATEDPNSGKLFDLVQFDRLGGAAGKELVIELLADGTVTRDGVKSTIPADQVKEISDVLDQMGFFGMQGVFQGVGTSSEVYTYYITVERAGSSRTITAQDGYIPPQLANLVQLLSNLGTK